MFDGTEVADKFECSICMELLHEPTAGERVLLLCLHLDIGDG
jgi:hypothetical protein